jgi:uncharacterized protein YqiB (DUF1249 family)
MENDKLKENDLNSEISTKNIPLEITEDSKFVIMSIKCFLSDMIEITDCVNSCIPRLKNIEKTVGSESDFYCRISNLFISPVIETIVIRAQRSQLANSLRFDARHAALETLDSVYQEFLQVMTSMESISMSPEMGKKYNSTKKSLETLYNENQIKLNNTPPDKKKSGGCYIATMAYGSYEHPQVMVLRQFRDETLDKSQFGRWFIKTYYHYSPKLVEKLEDKEVINKAIRKLLNQFIKLISRLQNYRRTKLDLI